MMKKASQTLWGSPKLSLTILLQIERLKEIYFVSVFHEQQQTTELTSGKLTNHQILQTCSGRVT